ncbi:hypothetical protein IV203_010305 [Nitzschia inconspicua]|uniref:Uncharacterized protein n=1 Tax=Nitzschia inconspicua TaxID=303405 RepID=A0A9K3KVV3_9STRA|nr:hypothetical protein IV203_010305 [Nitzschia inconspicua]
MILNATRRSKQTSYQTNLRPSPRKTFPMGIRNFHNTILHQLKKSLAHMRRTRLMSAWLQERYQHLYEKDPKVGCLVGWWLGGRKTRIEPTKEITAQAQDIPPEQLQAVDPEQIYEPPDSWGQRTTSTRTTKREKRNKKLALAGLPAISVRKNQNFPDGVGATRRESPDAVRAALFDLKSELMKHYMPLRRTKSRTWRKILDGLPKQIALEKKSSKRKKLYLNKNSTSKKRTKKLKWKNIYSWFKTMMTWNSYANYPGGRERARQRLFNVFYDKVDTFLCPSLLMLAVIGVGVWLILKYVVLDNTDPSSNGRETPSPPPGAGPFFGETPPAPSQSNGPSSSAERQKPRKG